MAYAVRVGRCGFGGRGGWGSSVGCGRGGRSVGARRVYGLQIDGATVDLDQPGSDLVEPG